MSLNGQRIAGKVTAGMPQLMGVLGSAATALCVFYAADRGVMIQKIYGLLFAMEPIPFITVLALAVFVWPATLSNAVMNRLTFSS